MKTLYVKDDEMPENLILASLGLTYGKKGAEKTTMQYINLRLLSEARGECEFDEKWLHCISGDVDLLEVKCNKCGHGGDFYETEEETDYGVKFELKFREWNFCPNCGAKIKRGGK